jgi:hypothetical protein
MSERRGMLAQDLACHDRSAGKWRTRSGAMASASRNVTSVSIALSKGNLLSICSLRPGTRMSSRSRGDSVATAAAKSACAWTSTCDARVCVCGCVCVWVCGCVGVCVCVCVGVCVCVCVYTVVRGFVKKNTYLVERDWDLCELRVRNSLCRERRPTRTFEHARQG